jgi:heterodisulfide reductase subunit D
MFNRETCKRCGLCLMSCPFLELPKEQAKEEVTRMIEKIESSIVLKNCTRCSYCDIICPTQSNPSELRKEIMLKKSRERGVSSLAIISEQVPWNLMSIGLEFEKEAKQKVLDAFSNPASNEEVFYLGCSLSYIYTDLAQTRLLEKLPVIGGMKYCCGGYVHNNFGKEEAAIKGRQLLKELKAVGVKKMITFCPGCDHMISGVYPEIIPEFDIQTINIAEYLLDQYQEGQLKFNQVINKKVTFHDSCAWRKLGPEIYEKPRRLLEAMGAEVVEMKHSRRESMCCGAPLSGRNPQAAAAIAEKRAMEAKATGAEAIVISCTGCFALSEKAAEQGLKIYNITELAQKAIGETPPHRIEIIKKTLTQNIMTKIMENPEALKKRYTIKNGEIEPK